MTFDERLAEQIRERLGSVANVEEKRIFGGIAFMVDGNMAVAASGNGGLLVRVDPVDGEALIASTHARPMEMRGRTMMGWLRVDPVDDLDAWVERGLAYVRTLPPK
ncbi:MAG: TfoX/Sxy family protein [Actinobacteria bacterium]|nr:TfoX/Sxy family protein [Actinomycetota bacterium]